MAPLPQFYPLDLIIVETLEICLSFECSIEFLDNYIFKAASFS